MHIFGTNDGRLQKGSNILGTETKTRKTEKNCIDTTEQHLNGISSTREEVQRLYVNRRLALKCGLLHLVHGLNYRVG